MQYNIKNSVSGILPSGICVFKNNSQSLFMSSHVSVLKANQKGFMDYESHRKLRSLFMMSWILVLCLMIPWKELQAQKHTCILGRPTDSSISLSILFDQQVTFQVEYGLSPSGYSVSTAPVTANAQTPVLQELTNLLPNKRYYYRLKFKKPGSTTLIFTEEYTFHTQRAPGNAFTFVIEADEHLYDKKGIPELYEITIANQAADRPDFMFSLGDMFGDDHTPETTTSEDMKELHMDYLQYLGRICHSAPFFFCIGNHEGENGFYLDQNNGNNIAVYGTQWRKYFYPNPFPNGFYTGNAEQEGFGIGYPENYYAFTWGDAQFIVLDVYRHCDINEKPKNWDWTLGEKQYQWFKKTLEESTSTFKFVMAHHTRGQGRGGIKTARAFEWGGYNGDNGTNYQFDTNRPGWGLPIHQLMVKHGVNVYFQGHDHVYAHESLDGVIYQTLPMPSDSTYRLGIEANGDAFSGIILDGCGHLRVKVQPDCATIEYVQSWLPRDTVTGVHKNREVAHSFTVGNCLSATDENNNASTGDILLYPNPASQIVTVQSDLFLQHTGSAWISDVQGRRLLNQKIEKGTGNFNIQTKDLPNGLYFIELINPVTSRAGKLLITHP